MARKPGYVLSLKLFVETPRDDFKKQSANAGMVADAVEKGEITEELIAASTVLSITGKMGSADLPEKPSGK